MIPPDHILHGDCLDILDGMPSESIDLVYLDPPFFTQSKQTLKSRDLTEYSFDDVWMSIEDYVRFLRERMVQIHRVMKDTATAFVHCDRKASHYIRVLLDEVFGYERFLSEIVWTYKRWSNSNKTLLPSHQTIFMYSKSDHYTFNEILQDYSETTNLDQILQKRERNDHGKSVYVTDDSGEAVLNGPKKGVPLSDTWEIPYLNPKARERTGYPTQKPLLLLERIIRLSSNEDETVLDPFCGSGTTCVAAKLLNRSYIGIDISEDAVELSRRRIDHPVRSNSNLLTRGREAYRNLPDYVVDILKSLPVKLVQRNSGIDAIHDEFIDGSPVVIRVQRTGETLVEAANKLHRAGKTKKSCMMLLIRTEQGSQQTAFVELLPNSVVVISSLNLAVQEHIDELARQSPQTENTV
jgi:site-specific DNA-methyltransferase (adenine-specific)